MGYENEIYILCIKYNKPCQRSNSRETREQEAWKGKETKGERVAQDKKVLLPLHDDGLHGIPVRVADKMNVIEKEEAEGMQR